MAATYTVRFHSHCGMSRTIAEDIDRDTAQELIRKRNAIARKTGHPVSRTGPMSWEHEEPEGCVMVPDSAGILSVRKQPARRRTRYGSCR